MKTETTNNPAKLTANVKKEFIALVDQLREDVLKMEDPSAKALFETAAEVILGLEKAFTDFEKKKEFAWR